MESDSFYDFPAGEEDVTTTTGVEEAEQLYVNRRAAEMELHGQLDRINNGQLHLNAQEKAILDSLRLQYIQCRWECLYDLEEHHRLRDAIIDELDVYATGQ